MAHVTISQISSFLYNFKFFGQDLQCFTFVNRDKNIQSLAELGMKSYQVRNIILKLVPSNYCSGPEKDTQYPDHNVWTFGYNLDGEEIYIKLSDNFSHNIAKCISFHKSSFSLLYPYKNEGE